MNLKHENAISNMKSNKKIFLYFFPHSDNPLLKEN
jgi:hypothetical protein